MASRAASAAATWTRQLFLEALFEKYHAKHSLEPTTVPMNIKQYLPFHVVTDCDSLHVTVCLSSLPEDRRAAIEVLALREIVLDEDGDMADLEDDMRLRELNVGRFYRWCDSKSMKADILTKMTSAADRHRWMIEVNDIKLAMVKLKDLHQKLAIPSRPRPRVPKELAKRIIAETLERPIADPR